jgi:hypothetical protein
MSGKIKVLVLVLMAAGAVLFGCLALQKAEGAKPSGDIQLRATIWNSTGAGVVSKIHNDGLGEYVSGEAVAGTVSIYIDARYGYASFSIDKGTNPSVEGRSVGLFFDDPVVGKPVMWMDTCDPVTDPLPFTSVVPQTFTFRVSYLFSIDPDDETLLNQEAPAGLDFRTMGMTVKTKVGTVTYPAQAYAGMGIGFTETSDVYPRYNIGGYEYAVKVTALEFNGPNGAPSHWKIESLRPPMHKDDAEDDDRMLLRIWETELNRTTRCGYAWFHFPFEIDLYRK